MRFTFALLLIPLLFGSVVLKSIADDSDPISVRNHGIQDMPDPVGPGFQPTRNDPR